MNDVTEIIRRAAADGWEVDRTNGGHLKFTHQDAARPVFCSSTPSDRRIVRNVLGEMRRAIAPETLPAPGRRKRKRRRPPAEEGFAMPRRGQDRGKGSVRWPAQLEPDHHDTATLADVWPR